MRYFIRVKDKITQEITNSLEELVDIQYISKYISTFVVDNIKVTLSDLEKLDFVKYITPVEIGSFAEGEFLGTITFQPPIRKSALLKADLCGWGDNRVFVLDSGVKNDLVKVTRHKDFTGKGPQDIKGHGTSVAKIINHFARGANIYSGKVGHEAPESDFMFQAIEWAIENDAKVINISSNYKNNPCQKGTCPLCEIVQVARSMGIAVVVAAGNDGDKNDKGIKCPGISDFAITIGAVDEKGKDKAEYSSIGITGMSKPNLITSGSVFINGQAMTGTSFAAPVVTGVIAASLSQHYTLETVLECIYGACEDIHIPKGNQGNGVFNIEKYVEVLTNEKIDIESTK